MSDASLPDDISQWPPDPYELFGIGRTAGMRDLRRAYAALIRRFKPEHHPQQFRRIRDAYEALEWRVRWRDRKSSAELPDGAEDVTDAATGRLKPNDAGNSLQDDSQTQHLESSEPASVVRRPTEDDVDLVWKRAIKHGADWQAVYQQLVRAAERVAIDEVLFCRLYWLLKVAPHVDTERQPVDWLAAGMARNTTTPRLMSLYFRELNRRPGEALRERSRALLSQSRPTWQLAELARHRWRALRRVDRLEEIAVDQQLLSGAFLSNREEWVQLMMTAVEVLVWSDDEAIARHRADCLREIDASVDVQLAMTAALDRHELLLLIAADYHQRKSSFHQEFPKGLVQLLPELWLNSDAARSRLVEILATWVDYPDLALNGLDSLGGLCPETLNYLTELLTSLAPRDSDDSRGAKRRAIENLIETHEWTLYRAGRGQLLQYCLRTGIRLDEIRDILLTDPKYAGFFDGNPPIYLRDLPLKCLLAGHRAFWR